MSEIPWNDLLTIIQYNMASNAEARRIIRKGGVRVNGEVGFDVHRKVSPGSIIKIGKHKTLTAGAGWDG